MSVTIITPSFNKSRYVLDAIKSVVSQSHQDWTYYIADNSTDDETRDAIKAYLRKAPDGRIKYLEVDYSDDFRRRIYIPSLICNALYVLADKKYVFYLSDDDTLHKDCLSSMAKFLDENPDIGACYCRGNSLRLVSKMGMERPVGKTEYSFGEIFDENNRPDGVIDGGQVLFRRSIVEKMVAGQEMIDLFPLPNKKGIANHSDGIFMNKLARHTKIFPCPYNSDKALMTHRCTSLSAHTPGK